MVQLVEAGVNTKSSCAGTHDVLTDRRRRRFRLTAKAELHNKLRKDIKSVIDMDDEAAYGRFLGCVHELFVATSSKVRALLENLPQNHPRPLGNETRKRPDLNARAYGQERRRHAPQHREPS